MAMKKTKAHITVTSILTVLSPAAECAWDDPRKWQKILQLYKDKIAASLAKIIIARKCITKKTQQISTALNRVCAHVCVQCGRNFWYFFTSTIRNKS